jgi:hypothetical protein
MKSLLVLISLFFTVDLYCQTNIYDLTLTTSDAQYHKMDEYQGRRIWISILPATHSAEDSAYLSRIDSIGLSKKGKFVTIVVPSYEEGYLKDSLNTLMQWYRLSLDSSIIITQPLYTHRSSGIQQNSLFDWLTHTEKNMHFDFEIKGAGSMFFINEQGVLYGVFGGEAKWSNRLLNHVMK